MPTHAKLTIVLVAAALAVPAAAVAQAPPAPPGPPPGNGATLPAPPGTAPAFVPPGIPGTIPAGASGPGLVGPGSVTLNRARRSFSLSLACQANGTVSVTARAATKGTIARASYRCAQSRSTARLTVTAKVARRLAAKRSVAATATVHQGAKAAKLSVTLLAGVKAPAQKGFWTDGHLQCADASGAPLAYLVEPDFTTATPTPVSTRGWVAWYTAGGGWHWLGVSGEDRGRWDTWTATPTGIAQFHPGGAPTPVPWTWGPIAVPTGQGVYAVGVYEVVYWVGGKPDYQWQYVNAGTTGAVAAGGGNRYCAY